MNADKFRSTALVLLVGAAALVLILLWALLGGGSAGASAGAQPAWLANPARSNTGAVMFTLTPRGVSDGRFRVDVQVNTHSGDLAQLDLKADTELRVGDRVLRPVEAPALRGHHTRGRLEFALEQVPEAFEIVIRGVRTMGPLTFRWP